MPIVRPHVYALLLSVQTAGLAIILWQNIPVYRRIVAGLPGTHASTANLIWTVLAVVLMQAIYWRRVKYLRSLDLFPNVVLSHIALFAGRLSFIFGAAFFGAVMYYRFPDLEKSIPRLIVLIAALFSIFCYSLELEWLALQLGGRNA